MKMGFKEYINEGSSDKILKYIYRKKIPLSPKFFEEVFGTKEIYCFVSMTPTRVPSIIKMQGSKKQVSSFTYFSNTNIFYGAWGYDWKDDYGGSTILAVLKGNHTLIAPGDAWTDFDDQGRRWISVQRYNNMHGKTIFTDILNNIQEDIFRDFDKEIKILGFRDPRDFDDQYIEGNLTNDVLYKVIKIYMDVSYDVLKKYKDKLIKNRFHMNPSYGYNEVLCYKFKIQEFIVIDKKSDAFDYTFDMHVDSRILKKYKFTFVDTVNEATKIIRNYQKKNKGQ
jgi:hypothetical protein